MVDRAVTFLELFNFRDLGGYVTSDGRTVAWRRLYRADDLARLAGDDADRFVALGIRTVVDLRRPEEIIRRGRMPELPGVAYHHLHLVHPNWPDQEYADVAERAAYLLNRYTEMSSEGAEAIGAALRLMADGTAAPLVFHCYAGKDRTGIVAALTLALLGVPDETIAADYALSEAAEEARCRYRGAELRPYVVAPAAAMLGLLAALRAEHGSIETYAKSLGITEEQIDALREHLLTP